jgi:hypothetical protein
VFLLPRGAWLRGRREALEILFILADRLDQKINRSWTLVFYFLDPDALHFQRGLSQDN